MYDEFVADVIKEDGNVRHEFCEGFKTRRKAFNAANKWIKNQAYLDACERDEVSGG